MPPYRILSFDGGGIMGLFTTTILERLVEKYPALLDNVDLIAGTSTGGIIALGLAHGDSPADLSALYRNKGKYIFNDTFWDDLLDLGNAIGADYSNKNLKRYLKQLFTTDTLDDLDKHVLVPSFDLDAKPYDNHPRAWRPKFFHNFEGEDTDGAELIVDVAMRTSAAPTYFPSYHGYIDGGVVANNPAMAAIAQAIDDRAGQVSLDDIVLLSVGVGIEPKYIKGQKLDWGWGEWARPLIAIMINGVMGVADHQCKLLLGEESYRRVNKYLDRPYQMDDVKPSSLQFLVDTANAMDDELDEIADWLDGADW